MKGLKVGGGERIIQCKDPEAEGKGTQCPVNLE